jgi:hypothetical protein
MNVTKQITTDPFSIYSIPRPFRIAFLYTPTESSFEIYDAILEYNCKVWGGRFNPMIPIIDGKIPVKYWQLLLDIDPDIIYLFNEISEETRTQIIKLIQPLEIIEEIGTDPPLIRLDINQIPVNYIIKKIDNTRLWDHYRENVIPISNAFDEKDRKLHNYIFRNLCIEEDRLNYRHYEKIFGTHIIKEDDLIENFFECFNQERNYIFPIQICSIDNNSHIFQEKSYYHNFCIIIEESIWSYIELWNRPIYYGNREINNIRQICAPLNFFENQIISKSFTKFIQKGLKHYSSGNNGIDIVSHKELSAEQKKTISKFCNQFNSFPRFIVKDPLDLPEVKTYIHNLEDMSYTYHQKLDKVKSNLTLSAPNFFERRPFDDHPMFKENYNWVEDYKIEYHPEKFKYTNQRFWWILNKRQRLPRLFFRNNLGRINRFGLISIKVDSKNKYLELSIPREIDVFYLIVQNEIKYHIKQKEIVFKSCFDYLQTSDKGRFLKTTVDLFGNEYYANFIYENNFWRKFFEDKCKVNIQNDDKRIEEIKNKIKKHIKDFVDQYSGSEDTKLEWLSRYILKTAKELKDPKIFFDFNINLEKPALDAIKSYSEKNNQKLNSEDLITDLKDSFSELLGRKIFFQGIKPKCEICGSSFWHSLEEITEQMNCRGCNNTFSPPFDTSWTFKINELIVNSFTYHGVFPVIWCINELYHRSKNLIYYPSTKLYREDASEAEVDLILLMDNKLAVCEVKTNIDEFNQSEIEKIKKVAMEIEADKIVLAGFYGDNGKLLKFKEHLENELKEAKMEIIVIYPAVNVFEEDLNF